jgi:hypothetical protein
VLLDQDLRRREQRDLMSVADGDDGRDQRDDGLPAADVALQEAVHRTLRAEVADDLA